MNAKGQAFSHIFYVIAGLFVALIVVGILLSVGERVVVEFNKTSGGVIPKALNVWGMIAGFTKIAIIVAIVALLIIFILSLLRPTLGI